MRRAHRQDYTDEFKRSAREENTKYYRDLTGNFSIPSDQQYWTLCHTQPPNDFSEIGQLCKHGLIVKEQFHGVDRDEDLIKENKEWHPSANWHHGEWVDVVATYKNFNPALVYLDTYHWARGFNSANLVSDTMSRCKAGTVLIVNVMGNNPRNKDRFDESELPKNLEKLVASFELRKWSNSNVIKVDNFEYNRSERVDMFTYIFQKVK